MYRFEENENKGNKGKTKTGRISGRSKVTRSGQRRRKGKETRQRKKGKETRQRRKERNKERKKERQKGELGTDLWIVAAGSQPVLTPSDCEIPISYHLNRKEDKK